MSNITTYVGATGVGLTSVISRIARKRLDEGKTVLTICDEYVDKVNHRNSTLVNHPDVPAVLAAYAIIKNSMKPDVVCIDCLRLSDLDIREICSLASKGVEFHIGQRAARRSGEEVSPHITSVISNVYRFSDQVFVLERTQGIDQEQYVLATPTKSRDGHANSIVFRINEYD